MLGQLHDRIDAIPTHIWVSRFVFPLVIAQRLTQFVSNELMDTFLLAYLWYVSELALHESWQTRRMEEAAQVKA